MDFKTETVKKELMDLLSGYAISGLQHGLLTDEQFDEEMEFIESIEHMPYEEFQEYYLLIKGFNQERGNDIGR